MTGNRGQSAIYIKMIFFILIFGLGKHSKIQSEIRNNMLVMDFQIPTIQSYIKKVN